MSRATTYTSLVPIQYSGPVLGVRSHFILNQANYF